MTRGKGAAQGAVLLLALLVAGGCAAKAKPLSQPRAQAMEHNRRGVEAEARGYRDKALAEFSEAFRLQGSIDNAEGMVVALINSARTQRLKGDLQPARQSVERAISLLPEGSDLCSELFYEKAKVLLAAGELEAATKWALRSEGAEKGEARGRRQNLVARLKLRQGFTEEARELLEQALELNRKAKLAAEEANSLRLLGEVALLQGIPDRASESYQGALLLDKELGLGAKVAADLAGLGDAAAQKGDRAGATGWYRRALEASKNGGDAARAAALSERLAQSYRLNGEETLARQIEEERKTLPAAKGSDSE